MSTVTIFNRTNHMISTMVGSLLPGQVITVDVPSQNESGLLQELKLLDSADKARYLFTPNQFGTKVLSGLQPTLLYSSDITTYYVALSAGVVSFNNVQYTYDGADALNYLSNGVRLSGIAAAALTADGKSADCMIVAYLSSGVLAIKAVFGAEAADGAEVNVLPSDALRLLDTSNVAILGHIKVRRLAVDSIDESISLTDRSF